MKSWWITDKEPLVTGAMSTLPYDAGLYQLCQFVDSSGKLVSMAERRGELLLVPRNLVRRPMVTGKDATTKGTHLFPVQPIALPPLTQEMADIIDKSVSLLVKDEQDHIIEAPTGWGKTYAGSAIAARVEVRTLIVVPKEDLMTQWHKTLVKLIGVNPGEIGRVQQDKCEYKDKRFVLGMLHSLCIDDRYEADFYSAFGMVVFDEVHRLGADHFSKVCGLFPARHRIGLSATPKRWDGKQKIFSAHLGPVLLRGNNVPMKPKVLVKRTGWKIPVGWQKNETGQWVKGTMKVTPGKMMGITKKQAASPERNEVITNFVVAAYQKGRRVVVISDLIDDHLKVLFRHFAAAGIPGEAMDYYIGNRKETELELAKNKPVVLATYAYTAEGTDVPEWDCLVMATPRANVKQTIGRVLRFKEGKPTPVIFDMVDDASIFQGFYAAREKQYLSVGAEIIKVK